MEGRPYLVAGEYAFFANASDQQIYRLTISTGESFKISDDAQYRYTNFLMSGDDASLICVAERVVDVANNESMIVAFRLDKDLAGVAFTVLASGADFYADLVVDTERQRIAWFEWDHPNMPWDASRLVMARYIEQPTIALLNTEVLIDSPDTSVCQPHFRADGALVFAIDGRAPPLLEGRLEGQDNFLLESWQLILWKDNQFEQLSFDTADYGAPFWVFGEHRLASIAGGLAAVRTSNGFDCVTRF